MCTAFFASLTLPVAEIELGRGTLMGFDILETGWLGPLNLQFAWFANPLMGLVTTLVALRILVPRALGWLLGLLFLQAAFWKTVPDDAGAHLIIAFGAGYYLWMTLLLTTALSPLLGRRVWL